MLQDAEIPPEGLVLRYTDDLVVLVQAVLGSGDADNALLIFDFSSLQNLAS